MASAGPRIRTNRLVTRDLGDELLVYDLERHKAYCLNRVARQVFCHCDGETTIQDMAVRIGDALGVPMDEQSVRLGLLRLEKAHLLENPLELTPRASRREALRTLGRAAMVVAPLVTAISVPTSAQAQASCLPNGSVCMTDSQCCSRRCQLTSGLPPGVCAG